MDILVRTTPCWNHVFQNIIKPHFLSYINNIFSQCNLYLSVQNLIFWKDIVLLNITLLRYAVVDIPLL